MNKIGLIASDRATDGSRNTPRRGDAAKVIIITVCVFLMIMFMLCVGGGIYGYILFQRNFGRIAMTAPADIQQLTTEITDIDLPPQFTPVMGSALMGMKTVNYAWNPDGKPITAENWHQHQGDAMYMLNMIEMAEQDQSYRIAQVQLKALKSQFKEYTTNTQEFTIRGKKCEFLFVTGQPTLGAFDDEMLYDEIDEERMMEEDAAAKPAESAEKSAEAAPTKADTASADPSSTPTETTAVPAESAPAANDAPTKPADPPLPKIRTVSGSFPGKSGHCTITIRLPADGTEDALLEAIIRSIH